MNQRILPLLALLAVTACGSSAEPVATTSQAFGSMLWWTQSFSTYGISLNGQSLNGKTLDGHGVVGVDYAGVMVGQQQASDVGLNGGALVGKLGHKKLAGRDFVGATLAGRLDDGDSVTLRIEDVVDNEDRANRDVQLYRVSYATQSGWLPLCGLDAGQPMLAIPVEGRWDYRAGVAGGGSHIDDDAHFTFACRRYAIAKCVELGYKPWAETRLCPGGAKKCAPTSIAELQQACVRALRADYCGDGTTNTVDGIRVNVYDAFGYHIAEPTWAFEAEWTADGARCASRLRVPSITPTCWSRLARPGCGSAANFADATLLMTQQER